MTLYSKSLSEYSVIPWISCKGEEGFIENTMDIFSIVNSTYAPLIFVRRVNECFWWDHESHMIDHVLPMSERHLLEEYEVSTICLMKWIDGATHLHEDLRKISNIATWKDEITRGIEEPTNCRDTISLEWRIFILSSSNIWCITHLLQCIGESLSVKSWVCGSDNYFHRFIKMMLQLWEIPEVRAFFEYIFIGVSLVKNAYDSVLCFYFRGFLSYKKNNHPHHRIPLSIYKSQPVHWSHMNQAHMKKPYAYKVLP